MKQVCGVFLPDGEKHMPDYLRGSAGQYQNAQLLRALEFVASWQLAVDIGAHVGLWSKVFVQRFAAVVAFEPLAPLRACLERNVVSNRLQIVPMALGNEHGSVSFDYDESHTGATHVAPGRKGLVPLGKLDDFRLENVDFIKLDVEGFELSVLQGAAATLEANKPVVIVEEKCHGARHFGQTAYASIHFLESLGAVVLDRVVDDLILGWPDVPGRVRPAAPAPADRLLASARARHQANDLEGARIGYRLLLRHYPAIAEGWNMLAAAELQRSQFAAALEAAHRAVAIMPVEARYQNTLGACWWLSGHSAEAIAAVERAVQLQPNLSESYVNLGEMRETLGQTDAARAAYERALRFSPNSADILQRLGRIHAQARHPATRWTIAAPLRRREVAARNAALGFESLCRP